MPLNVLQMTKIQKEKNYFLVLLLIAHVHIASFLLDLMSKKLGNTDINPTWALLEGYQTGTETVWFKSHQAYSVGVLTTVYVSFWSAHISVHVSTTH